MKQFKVMRSALEVVYKISKFLKKSPKRDAALDKLKGDLAPDTPGFRVPCPTCWTVRGLSLQSVLDNYEVLLSVWEEALDGLLDSEINASMDYWC